MPNNPHKHRLTKEEFQRAVRYTRLEKRSKKAARLALVDGMSYAEVGREVGMSRQQVYQISKIVRNRMDELPW